jgi:hypothetical protein
VPSRHVRNAADRDLADAVAEVMRSKTNGFGFTKTLNRNGRRLNGVARFIFRLPFFIFHFSFREQPQSGNEKRKMTNEKWKNTPVSAGTTGSHFPGILASPQLFRYKVKDL